MEIGISYNVSQIESIKGYATKLMTNVSTGVPQELETMMDKTRSVAAEKTHVGPTKRLHQAWRIQRRGNVLSLYNIMSYAAEEFSRGGQKTAGYPPLGPHNVIPEIMDLMASNIESTVAKALMNGLTR